MPRPSEQEVVAKALWVDGNNRIGHRPWEKVRLAYMAEAGHAVAALRANGFLIVHPESSAEDCEDPYVCCIHERPRSSRSPK